MSSNECLRFAPQNVRAAEAQTDEVEDAGLENLRDVSDEALAVAEWRQSLARVDQSHLTRFVRSCRRRLESEQRRHRTDVLDERRKHEAQLQAREEELQRLRAQMAELRASEQGASDFSVDLKSAGALLLPLL